jgi:type VI secretion system secreted protein Hcp
MFNEPPAGESYSGESLGSWAPETPFTQPETPFNEWEQESSVGFESSEQEGYEAEEQFVPQLSSAHTLVGGAQGIAQHGEAIGSSKFFFRITGRKQGQFAGDGHVKGREDWLTGSSFDHQVSSPRDVLTGAPSGKRHYQPLTITHPWSSASPQIFTALVTNEVLSTVEFEFVATTSASIEKVAQRIRLTNASVSDVRRTAGLSGPAQPPVERVSFFFQRIEFDDLVSGKSAQDDWDQSATELEFGEAGEWSGESEGEWGSQPQTQPTAMPEYEYENTPSANWGTETYELDKSGVRPCDDRSRIA